MSVCSQHVGCFIMKILASVAALRLQLRIPEDPPFHRVPWIQWPGGPTISQLSVPASTPGHQEKTECVQHTEVLHYSESRSSAPPRVLSMKWFQFGKG